MTEKTLLDFLNGQLSTAERRAVLQWIEASDENRQKYHMFKARHTVAKFNTPHLNVEKGYLDVNKRTQANGKILRNILRAAAAVLLVVSTWLVWNMAPESPIPSSEINSVAYDQISATDRGENHEITLPDGSTALLNADSRLTWKSDFEEGSRDIHLEGEAFFDVVHDPRRPFIVHTGQIDVKVLGTTFNVRAYPDDAEPITTLVSGSVEVTGQSQSKVTLRPLQTAVLDRRAERFEIFDIKENEAAPWRDGKLIFRDAPLENVIRDIERKYDVECNVESLEMKDFLFTGTFDNLTIEEVLRVLKISSDIDYKIEGKSIELF